jgi:hypothetical protein
MLCPFRARLGIETVQENHRVLCFALLLYTFLFNRILHSFATDKYQQKLLEHIFFAHGKGTD